MEMIAFAVCGAILMLVGYIMGRRQALDSVEEITLKINNITISGESFALGKSESQGAPTP